MNERNVQLDSQEIFLHVNMYTVIILSYKGRLEEFQRAYRVNERRDSPATLCRQQFKLIFKIIA